ncbi:hypothetical protein [Thermomonospora umbrina]|uniref:Uncharacterized protein n=1 Tax=Thermomonospora umbrina TaxID=111806 RepID=A0A3D9SMU5_9ACTN|nr:hypothetical protein [Thermomonospora umbrina]REE97239.1 hypothetical protein DFJ69_2703 [Thermomonospora umbrina]
MPDALEGHRARRIAVLNTDGEPHTLQNTLTMTAFVLGISALVLGFIPALHFLGTLAGVIGFPMALYAQLISATTGERWFNVVAMVSAFVGTGFALSHGGFSV